MTSRRLLDAPARTLLDAADYIEKHGWCQNHAENEKGEVCITGAIVIVRFEPHEHRDAVRKFRSYIGVDSIPVWNDKYKRTKEEVLAALRGAALS